MEEKFYITTPLYYVNSSPHIGHSYTNIACDTLARFKRAKLGKTNVWFLTGTDEHGQKIKKAADAKNLSPQDFTDEIVPLFKELWQKLGISYDDFIRTTEARHKNTVAKALTILKEKGDIFMAQYEGWYCVPCESFWTQTQAGSAICPDCQRPIEKITESNYFFSLSKYQGWLIDYIEAHPDFIRPLIRRNEVLSFLKLNSLTDLCISRPKERLNWGIAFPFSSEHVVYVWFDALLNYISAVGEFNKDGVFQSRWWPADLHIIGKDILRQHAVYWPIMLKALDIPMPSCVFAHGWWMLGENKMSKSRGNVVNPLEMVEKYGIDAYRYFLLRDVPFGMDGNFSEDALIKRFNSDLANDLGNLVYRSLTMTEKYFASVVPNIDIFVRKFDEAGESIKNKIKSLPQDVEKFLTPAEDFNFGASLEETWKLIAMANKYVEETKPWNLSKEGKLEELSAFIRLLIEVVRAVSKELLPFMPVTASAIIEQAGQDIIKKGSPLFPRLEIPGATPKKNAR